EDGALRPQAARRDDARPDDHPQDGAGHPHRDDLGREGGRGPHQLPRRDRRREAEDHADPAQAGQVSGFAQLLVAGLATGAIYARPGMGFWRLCRPPQTTSSARGEFVMLPAFSALAPMKSGAPPSPAAAAAGVVVTVLVLG